MTEKKSIVTFRNVLNLILIVIALLIIFQNQKSVTYHFLFWEFTTSQVVFLIVFALIGFIFGYTTKTVRTRRRYRR